MGNVESLERRRPAEPAESPAPAPGPGNVAAPAAVSPCQDTFNHALALFVDLLEETSADGRVKIVDVHRLVRAFTISTGPLEAFFHNSLAHCLEFQTKIRHRAERSDLVCRVIVESFHHPLNDPESGISRQILPRFQIAVRMILGERLFAESMESLKAVGEELDILEGDVDEWRAFYADPRCTQVFERALIAIASKFRRFEMRLEWFLTLMNTDPETESLDSHAFVCRKRDKGKQSNFTHREFHLLFSTMFESVRLGTMDEERTAQFIDRFGITPKDAFGKFFVDLAKTGHYRRQPANRR